MSDNENGIKILGAIVFAAFLVVWCIIVPIWFVSLMVINTNLRSECEKNLNRSEACILVFVPENSDAAKKYWLSK